MKNEAEFKTAFKKSVKAQGGFSISLAAPMVSGVPDLYVIMPRFTPVLLEAKWLGEVPIGFDKKIKATKLQQMTLDECNKVHFNSALYLVGYKLEKKIWACLVIHNCGYVSENWIRVEYINKSFDVKYLFLGIGVTRIHGS